VHSALPPQIWIVVALKKWYKVFQHNFTHHQELLDKLLFPLLAKKVRPSATSRLPVASTHALALLSRFPRAAPLTRG
jgi:hypothetical protein